MVSVIVPVFNAEKYLHKCIDSILAQTHTDFELLLINDGSKDNSGAICDEYAAKDNRIRVFHKENAGVSKARNLGLDNAKGEWITFVDSDDWVHEDFIKKRLALALNENADIAYCDVEYVYRTHNVYCKTAEQVEGKASTVNSWILSRTTYSPIILVRKSLFDKYGLRYIEGLRFGEDFNFIIKLVMYANKVSHIKDTLYYYNKQNEGSAMTKLHLYRDDLQFVYTDLIEYFKKEGIYNQCIEMISWCILEYKLVCIVKGEHTFKELRDFIPESHRFIFNNGFLDFKSKIMLFLYKIDFTWFADFMLWVYRIKNRS